MKNYCRCTPEADNMSRERPQSMHALMQADQRSFVGGATWIVKMFQAKDAEEFVSAGNHLHQT